MAERPVKKKRRVVTEEKPSGDAGSSHAPAPAPVLPKRIEPVARAALPRHVAPPPEVPGGSWSFNTPCRVDGGGAVKKELTDAELVAFFQTDARRRKLDEETRPAVIPPERLCVVRDGLWDVLTGALFYVEWKGRWLPCLVSSCDADVTRVRLLEKGDDGKLRAVGEPIELKGGWQSHKVIAKEERDRAVLAAQYARAAAARRLVAGATCSSPSQFQRLASSYPECLGEGEQSTIPVAVDYPFPPLPQFGTYFEDPRYRPHGGFTVSLDVKATRVPEGGWLRGTPSRPPPGERCAISGLELPKSGWVGRVANGKTEFASPEGMRRWREKGLRHLAFLWVSGDVERSDNKKGGRKEAMGGARKVELLWEHCKTSVIVGRKPDVDAENLRDGVWWVDDRGVIHAHFDGALHKLARLPRRQRLFPLDSDFSEASPPYGIVLSAKVAEPGSVLAFRCMTQRKEMSERLRDKEEDTSRALREVKAGIRKRKAEEEEGDKDLDSGDEAPNEEGLAGTDQRQHLMMEALKKKEDEGSSDLSLDASDSDDDLASADDDDEENADVGALRDDDEDEEGEEESSELESDLSD
eukprot:Hpha_TRINITY_DN13977_c0_g1::TRINITY_DN13977_c0_g1_i1::g.35572::m.35572